MAQLVRSGHQQHKLSRDWTGYVWCLDCQKWILGNLNQSEE